MLFSPSETHNHREAILSFKAKRLPSLSQVVAVVQEGLTQVSWFPANDLFTTLLCFLCNLLKWKPPTKGRVWTNHLFFWVLFYPYLYLFLGRGFSLPLSFPEYLYFLQHIYFVPIFKPSVLVKKKKKSNNSLNCLAGLLPWALSKCWFSSPTHSHTSYMILSLVLCPPFQYLCLSIYTDLSTLPSEPVETEQIHIDVILGRKDEIKKVPVCWIWTSKGTLFPISFFISLAFWHLFLHSWRRWCLFFVSWFCYRDDFSEVTGRKLMIRSRHLW